MFQMDVHPSMFRMSVRPLSILTLIAFCNLQRCRQLYSTMFIILILQSKIYQRYNHYIIKNIYTLKNNADVLKAAINLAFSHDTDETRDCKAQNAKISICIKLNIFI